MLPRSIPAAAAAAALAVLASLAWTAPKQYTIVPETNSRGTAEMYYVYGTRLPFGALGEFEAGFQKESDARQYVEQSRRKSQEGK